MCGVTSRRDSRGSGAWRATDRKKQSASAVRRRHGYRSHCFESQRSGLNRRPPNTENPQKHAFPYGAGVAGVHPEGENGPNAPRIARTDRNGTQRNDGLSRGPLRARDYLLIAHVLVGFGS